MPSQSEIRDEVTARIIEALEADLLPWRRPWRATRASASQPGRHSNVASRKAYRGINSILLELHAMQHGLTSRWWGTFPMWKSLGCNIKKRPPNIEDGHWGCRVVFWKPLTRKITDDPIADEEEEERRFVLRTFVVFCADQVDGAEPFQVHDDEGQTDAQPDFAPAEELILGTKADIRFGGDRAYYHRPMPAGSFPNHTSGDFICVPPKASFRLPGAFYETIVHELAHNAACRIMPRRMRRYRRIMGIPTRQLGIIKAIRGTQAARRSDGIARDASPVRRLAPAPFL